MIMTNFIWLSVVSISYIILIFGLSSIMLKPIKSKKTFSDKILLYFIIGNFYVMNTVFVLLFLRCTSRILTIVVLLAGAIGIRYLFNKVEFKSSVSKRVNTFVLLTAGAYGWKFFRKERVSSILRKLKYHVFILIKDNIVEVVGYLACLGIHAYYTGYRFVNYSSLGVYDEAVHLEWIQNMLKGDIFCDGAYPYGLHNILYAIITIFDFKAFTVIRYFGFVLAMFLVIILYILLKKICRLKYTPFVGFFLYVAANLYWDFAWDRLQFTIPQEYAIIFLYPMAVYLYCYLRDKKRQDLVLFGLCFSMILYVHLYVTIIALILCFCMVLSRIVKVFQEKLFHKIIIYGIISTLVGILPMGIGVLTGHELQGSLYWALGVITGEVDEEEDEFGNIDIDIKSETETEEQLETESQLNVLMEGSLKDKIITIGKILREQAVEKVMKNFVFILLLIGMALVFINTVIRNIFRITKNETFFQFSMMLYIGILLVLLSSKSLGIPVIIEDYRISVFLSYAVPVMLCMQLEILFELFEHIKRLKILINICVIMILGTIVYGIYTNNHARELSRFTLIQSDSAVKVLYDIFDNYDDNPWTIVSSVEEYSIVLDCGYHYELIDLLFKMEQWNEDTAIYIPTTEVFFFVEKRPIEYGDVIYLGSERKKYPKFTSEDANTTITKDYLIQPDLYYLYQRATIMAKTYYWAEKYMSYFPNEMSVYYEDDSFICYHLKQDPYYLNNLAIDYGYNIDLMGQE